MLNEDDKEWILEVLLANAKEEAEVLREIMTRQHLILWSLFGTFMVLIFK